MALGVIVDTSLLFTASSMGFLMLYKVYHNPLKLGVIFLHKCHVNEQYSFSFYLF